ncbi:hypothetical protein MP228_010600 [Amoeboaphelidium protococcarum]|nr:hypothetical protein MP228_010600 [Amoeboaphelidium protococcarum]
MTIKLYKGDTYHSRYIPVKHTFEYPVWYVGVDFVRDVGNLKNSADQFVWAGVVPLFKLNSHLSLLSIHESDYMAIADPFGGVQQLKYKESWLQHRRGIFYAIERLLMSKGLLPAASDADNRVLQRVHTITMPRLLGYSFNPVSFHYAYATTSVDGQSIDNLLAVVLEVNNTFGETHLYTLPCGSDKVNVDGVKVLNCRSGYDYGFLLKRMFHVSPFNDLRGDYEIQLTDPARHQDGLVDVRIIFWQDQEGEIENIHSIGGGIDLKQPQSSFNDNQDSGLDKHLPGRVKKFMAYVRLQPSDATPGNIVRQLLKYPLTILLTSPRIMMEAYLLTYHKRLAVYPKPDPQSGGGNTIVYAQPDAFEKYCMNLVLRWMRHQQVDISIQLCDPKLNPIIIGDGKLGIKLNNYNLFTWLVIQSDWKYVIHVLFEIKSIEIENDCIPALIKAIRVSEQNQKQIVLKHYPSMAIVLFCNFIMTCMFNSVQDAIRDLVIMDITPLNRYMIAEISLLYNLVICIILLYYSVFAFMQYWFFDQITPWAKGYEPSPWSILDRYRL